MTDDLPVPTIDARRRRLIGAMTLTVSTAAFAGTGLAQGATPARTLPFSALKHVDAGVLSVGYADLGPVDGTPVLLLHGWPYDVHAFAEVGPRLAAAGYRVIIPHLRGYGSTRFRSADTPRNGQQMALAADGLALMDALGLRRAIVAGFDWGARTADIMAALWPERCKALVSVSGYLIEASCQISLANALVLAA